MKNPVIIKSFPNGLSIYLDAEMPFSQLLEEIAVKFKESANFFKDASMVVSFEGRELTFSVSWARMRIPIKHM